MSGQWDRGSEKFASPATWGHNVIPPNWRGGSAIFTCLLHVLSMSPTTFPQPPSWEVLLLHLPQALVHQCLPSIGQVTFGEHCSWDAADILRSQCKGNKRHKPKYFWDGSPPHQNIPLDFEVPYYLKWNKWGKRESPLRNLLLNFQFLYNPQCVNRISCFSVFTSHSCLCLHHMNIV